MIEENKVTHIILVKLMKCQSFANGLAVRWVLMLGVCLEYELGSWSWAKSVWWCITNPLVCNSRPRVATDLC